MYHKETRRVIESINFTTESLAFQCRHVMALIPSQIKKFIALNSGKTKSNRMSA